MKIGIAMMSHETNTFSPVITDLDRFSCRTRRAIAWSGGAGVYRGTASCLGGYIEVAEKQSVDIEMGIAASAPPSGPVENEAYSYMCDAIVELAGRVDGLLLDLHGAMTTQSHDDGEGELLRRIRAENPELPDRHIARHARQYYGANGQQLRRADGLSHLPPYRHG